MLCELVKFFAEVYHIDAGGVKLGFHGTDIDTDTDTDIGDAPIV